MALEVNIVGEAVGCDGGSQLLQVWLGASLMLEVVEGSGIINMECHSVVGNVGSEGLDG